MHREIIRTMKVFFVLIFALFSSQLILADELVVDGSSAASTKSSLAKMQKGFSRDEKMVFNVALLQIQLSDVKSASEAIEQNLVNSLIYKLLGPKIDGLNYEEIMELAKNSPTKASIK